MPFTFHASLPIHDVPVVPAPQGACRGDAGVGAQRFHDAEPVCVSITHHEDPIEPMRKPAVGGRQSLTPKQSRKGPCGGSAQVELSGVCCGGGALDASMLHICVCNGAQPLLFCITSHKDPT
eukprot:1138721-Pelagomonas_calceolata.AAC.3